MKFVFVDKLKSAMEIAFKTNENIILYGKGGHGKSEFTEAFFKDKGITPFVKTLGSGTTTDSLFGGIDIQLFEKTGKIEYLVENSFMNFEYVVLEELFDSPDYILEQLKDILTSKRFRNGTQIFPLKTKLIVCCTNKTRDEFSKNDSLRALMERFPLEIKVEWPNYTQVSYSYLFKEVMGKGYKELEYILAKLHQSGTTVSPRIAIKAARMIDECGLDCLDFIAEFGGKNKPLVDAEREKYKNVSVIEELLEKMLETKDEIGKANVTNIDGIKECKKLIKRTEALIAQAKTKKSDDETLDRVNKIIAQVSSIVKNKKDEMERILKENE
jgi:hypothetical protein